MDTCEWAIQQTDRLLEFAEEAPLLEPLIQQLVDPLNQIRRHNRVGGAVVESHIPFMYRGTNDEVPWVYEGFVVHWTNAFTHEYQPTIVIAVFEEVETLAPHPGLAIEIYAQLEAMATRFGMAIVQSDGLFPCAVAHGLPELPDDAQNRIIYDWLAVRNKRLGHLVANNQAARLFLLGRGYLEATPGGGKSDFWWYADVETTVQPHARFRADPTN